MILFVDGQRELHLDLFAPQIELDLNLAGGIHFMHIHKTLITCLCPKADVVGIQDVGLLVLDCRVDRTTDSEESRLPDLMTSTDVEL